MKKVFSLLIIAMIFTACSSDDDNASVSLEGTWKMTAFKSENPHDLNQDGIASVDIMGQTDCYQNETIIFNTDNSATINSSSYLEITAELEVGTTDNYQFSFECIQEAETETVTWTQNGNTVVVTNEFFALTGTIQSSGEISFVVPSGFEAELEGDGTVVVTEDITIVYTKQ